MVRGERTGLLENEQEVHKCLNCPTLGEHWRDHRYTRERVYWRIGGEEGPNSLLGVPETNV